MLAHDRIRPRRVDDVHVAQQIDWRRRDAHPVIVYVSADGLAVPQHVNLSGRGSDAFLQHAIAGECVDERALPRVELADDDQEEELVELADRRRQGCGIVWRCAEPGQRFAKLAEEVTRLGKLPLQRRVENAMHSLWRGKKRAGPRFATAADGGLMRCCSRATMALCLGVCVGLGLGTGSCASRDAAPSPPTGTGESAPAQAQLTPQNLEELMKKIGPAHQSLVAHLQANDTAEAAKTAQQLAEWFGGVEKFWTQRGRREAIEWAAQARTFASNAAGAAATGDEDTASGAANQMGAMCKQCHTALRESDGAGGYRIRGS